ncbi:MAG TPA: hypothetical protein VF820_03545 [Patescibacteria group bacterium]
MPKLEATQVIEEHWDIKKIIIGTGIFLLLAGAAYAAKEYFSPVPNTSQDITHVQTTIGVKGAETSSTGSNPPTQQSQNNATFSLPSSTDIQNQIQNIQQQVTHLNISDLASSSPQVQAILQQIEQLPNAPANVAKEACINLCNRL